MAKTTVRGAQIADGANGVDLTVDVTGTLPVANGGTGADTLTGVLVGNGTSAVTAVAAPSGTIVGTTDSQTLTGKTLTTPVLNGTPTGTGVATAATASTLALRDSNGNVATNSLLEGYTSTATAAGTTTLTVGSTYLQVFTGSTTQTVVLPVTSTLVLGQQYWVVNSSTGAVTVQSSGTNSVIVLAGGTSALVTCVLVTGTTAASWQATYFGAVAASGKILSASNTLTLAGTDGTTITFQASDTYVGRATTDTLTNKTLTSPAINTPTGIVKGDVGLGNVDNTSDATKNAASVTLTNKTLTTPVLNGTPTGTGVATAATASTLALRDANGNIAAAGMLEGYTTTATAAGTTTLTVASNYLQYFTGSSTQTVTLPVASTLVLGQQWLIVNQSTGAVTVQSSGSNSIVVIAASTSAMLTCILASGTGTGSWQATYFGDVVTSAKKLSVSNTLTLAGTDGTTITFQATDTYVGRATTDTLTNKTLTSPVINTPTGIVKGDVGLGNVDNTSNATERAATATLTNKRVNPRAVTVTSASTHTIDSDATDIFTVTAQAAAVTFAAPTGTPVAGQKLMIRIKDNATARAITWNGAFVSSGIATLPSTTVISKTHHIGFVYDEVAAKWMCLAADPTGY